MEATKAHVLPPPPPLSSTELSGRKMQVADHHKAMYDGVPLLK
jgi:hypothetical protein